MFDILANPIRFADTALACIRMTYRGASENDMVRACETDGFHTERLSYLFAERKPADAMAQALAFLMPSWEKQPGCTLTYYTDEHGVWCVECSESMYTGDEGGHVCGNERCKNFDADKLPVWVKELHNVA